ncbi:hypothetical protein [Leifsonia sp. NPDC077715]|uniref:hypothetical protein n=1 Tax=Leifsonia sp. NPDC077715 TaxID=3155539 RepID=UPI0034283DFF
MRVRSSLVRLVAVVYVALVVTTGTSACSILGVPMNQQLSTEGNLANQKKVAAEFIKDYPHPELESIRFMAEGSVKGSGNWSAYAVVTIAGKNYDEVLGTSLSLGEGLPTVPPGPGPGPVTVIYSDDSKGLIE